jgi:hypothetical protein
MLGISSVDGSGTVLYFVKYLYGYSVLLVLIKFACMVSIVMENTLYLISQKMGEHVPKEPRHESLYLQLMPQALG